MVTGYLQDLGVANFEFLETKNIPLVAKIKTQILIVEQNSTNSFCKNSTSRDLLALMLKAIGVDIAKTICINSDSVEQLSTKYIAPIIILAGDFVKYENDYFVIPHPAEILKTPELKRDAWEILKKVKENL